MKLKCKSHSVDLPKGYGSARLFDYKDFRDENDLYVCNWDLNYEIV